MKNISRFYGERLFDYTFKNFDKISKQGHKLQTSFQGTKKDFLYINKLVTHVVRTTSKQTYMNATHSLYENYFIRHTHIQTYAHTSK